MDLLSNSINSNALSQEVLSGDSKWVDWRRTVMKRETFMASRWDPEAVYCLMADSDSHPDRVP